MAYLKEEIKAGVMIAVFVLLLSAIAILLGGVTFFEKFDTYYIKVVNVAGLDSGAQVKLGGVRVGSITEVKIPDAPGEKITVTLGLKEGTPLYQGTTAHISQAGFVGDIFLLLSVKDTSNEKIQVGATIPSVEKVDMSVVLAKVDGIAGSVETLVRDVNKVFSQEAIQDLEEAIKNTSVFLKDITGLAKGVKGELSVLIASAQKDLDKAGEAIVAIKKTAVATESSVKEIKETAKSFKKLTQTSDGVITRQSENLTGLIKVAQKDLEKAGETIESIKNVADSAEPSIVAMGDSAKAIKETATTLTHASKTVDRFLTDESGTLSSLLKTAKEDLEKAGEAIVAIKKLTVAAEASVIGIGDGVKSVEGAAQSTKKTAQTAERAIQLQSANVTDLLISMTNTSENLQEVLQELKSKPWGILYKEGRTENE